MPNPIIYAVISIEVLVSPTTADQATGNQTEARKLHRWIKRLSKALDDCIDDFRDDNFTIRLVPEWKVKD